MAFAGRNGFEDEAEDPPVKRLTSAEAAALQERNPSLSPWRVVAAQLAVGVVVAAVAGMVGGSVAAVSALYGALVVVLPGALMARGTTGPMSRSGWMKT